MQMKQPKFCILGAAFNNHNLGVGALARGIVTAIVSQYPDADVSILDYAREASSYDYRVGDRVVSIQIVNVRFSKKVYLSNNIALLILLTLLLRLVPFSILRKKWMLKNRVLRHILQADAIVSIAGGDSFSDIYGLGRLAYVALPQILILCAGRELVLLPQTLGPFRTTSAKAVAKFIMKRATSVYARDRESICEAEAILGKDAEPGKLKLSYDMGFVMPPVAPAQLSVSGWLQQRDGAPLVGLNVSGLLFVSTPDGGDPFGFRDRYRKLVYRIIDFFVAETNARVLLIPHVLGTGAESDSDACAQVYEKLAMKCGDRIHHVEGWHSPGEMKYIIGQCDFFLGSRMHACIAALSQSIPTVALAYSRKFLGVMETIGVEDIVLDPQAMTADDILHAIARVYQHKDELRQRLKNKMPEVKEDILNFFSQAGAAWEERSAARAVCEMQPGGHGAHEKRSVGAPR
jgi:polysaccharide pyruvyl transferase WcaK-like protein